MICSSCRRAWEGKGSIPYEDDNGFTPDTAVVRLEGITYVGDRKIPFRACVCRDHAHMMSQDSNWEIKREIPVTKEG